MRRAHLVSLLLALAALAVACRKASELEIAAYHTPDLGDLQSRTFEALWSTVNEQYVYNDFHGTDWEAVGQEYRARLEQTVSGDEFTNLLHEMLAELPPGAARLQSRNERIESEIADPGSFEGIGSFVALRGMPEPRVLLLSIIPGSPAEEAGLQAHDAILAIDGTPVRNIDAAEVVSHIRGPAGSEVELMVRSPGGEPRDVVVNRRRVEQAGETRLDFGTVAGSGIGYFLFPPSDYEELVRDFLLGLQALNAGGDLEAIILDLRIVSASSGWPADQLLTIFVDGAVGTVYTRSRSTEVSIPDLSELSEFKRKPVAILVGPDTSGAAEIFAAVMQSEGRALIVGSPTPGELETVSSFVMPDGSRALVATSSFRTSTGYEVGLRGVEPDVPFDVDWDQVTGDDDPLRDFAALALIGGRT